MPFDRMTKLSWIYDLYRLGQGAIEENATDLYQRILTHIVDGSEAKSGSLALCSDPCPDPLTIVAGIDLPDGVVGSQVAVGDGVLGWVAQEGKPLLLNGDASSDRRFHHATQGRGGRSRCSAICWPLWREGRIIGAVSVNRPEGEPMFTQGDLECGTILLDIVSLALGNLQLHVDRNRRLAELQQANHKLEAAQSQLLQSEKLASIGQLAAGVAHEINNPIGYVYSNLGTLERYVGDLFSVLDAYGALEGEMARESVVLTELRALKGEVDLPFLREDLAALLGESKEGITRVKKIVQDLKDFSHADAEDEWQWADLHKGLDSTLNIVWNELKYKAEVVKAYGDLPDIECLPSQLNQVFMNLLVNAAHAIDGRGTIAVRSGADGGQVWVEVADTGKGILPQHMNRIFDPFFTTKPVGKGTGLGLSLSYSIVQKHHGRIHVDSEPGKGSAFRVWLPVRHAQSVNGPGNLHAGGDHGMP
ncbi:MAG: ATP-binding protein [Betaproteobacteria bacterium]|nr:ATP-binding protein [Betaproteobacteria bacterium]